MMRQLPRLLALAGCLLPLYSQAQPAPAFGPNTRLLTTSLRTGNTEVFWVNPLTGDAFNITKAPATKERYPVWSPGGQQVVEALRYQCAIDGSRAAWWPGQ